MWSNILYSAIGSLLIIVLLWLLKKCWNGINAIKTLLSELPQTAIENIDTATKQKQRNAAYKYAEHVLHEARFTCIYCFILAILFAVISHDFSTDTENWFPITMRLVTCYSSGILFITGLIFLILSDRISLRLRNFKKSDIE